MTYTAEEENLIILCSFGELTYNARFLLLSSLGSDTPDFEGCKESLIKNLSYGVYNKVKEAFYSDKYRKGVLENLNKKSVECITYFSNGYPELLKRTPYPPIVLYCKGNRSLLNTRMFAVVGSRKTNSKVLKQCSEISRELTRYFTVVSGMADGADSAAVEGALKSGKVISVLANGFDHFYPAMNRNLIKEVEKRGLLITEYPPEVPPRSYQFPVRNRIIAGLAEGTLVVSAGRKSGALITAEYAVDYSRHLFAFPYSVGVAGGEGCNYLIKNGAFLTEDILDLCGIFGIEYTPETKTELSSEERELLSLISESEAAFVPNLAAKMGKEPFKLIPILSSLEMKGLVVRLGGNRYSAVK